MIFWVAVVLAGLCLSFLAALVIGPVLRGPKEVNDEDPE